MIELLMLLSNAVKQYHAHLTRPQKCNSVIRLRHDVRRERIKELGELGLNQAQITREMDNISYSTVKREIKAINEGLV